MHLLIVEDDDRLRRLLKRLLEEQRRRLRAVGLAEQAERAELLLDEVPHVVRGDEAVDPRPEGVGERRVVALAVGRGEQVVQDRRELDRLPVGAAHERRRAPVPGTGDRADELDALGARRRDRGRRRGRGPGLDVRDDERAPEGGDGSAHAPTGTTGRSRRPGRRSRAP